MNRRLVGWVFGWSFVLLLFALTVPGMLIKSNLFPSRDLAQDIVTILDEPEKSIGVYLAEIHQVEYVSLEEYVRGVIAGEMYDDFELEALKAQAIAARTYIVRKWMKQDFSGVPEGFDALVSDSQLHQVYVSKEKLKSKNIKNINRAVIETKGKIMTYAGEPIQATYFSTSNGRTEHSEHYWADSIPYLRSVESHWDVELSPKYKQSFQFTLTEVEDLLDLSKQSLQQTSEPITILAKTAGERVKEIKMANKIFTGREIREKLDLPSSDFAINVEEDIVHITTYGYGHGVGMSQWGAQGMALNGDEAEEILRHYYRGIEFELVEEQEQFSL